MEIRVMLKVNASGLHQAMMRAGIETATELSEKSGVSLPTVRKAMRGGTLSSKTAQRIWRKVEGRGAKYDEIFTPTVLDPELVEGD